MVPVIFSILSVAACTFLIYVLVQFRRAMLDGRHGFARGHVLQEVDVRRTEAVLMSARRSSHANRTTRAHKQAVISAVIGIAGLLAPFIFVILLSLSNRWHR
jgi:hypothetical protein